MKTKHTRNRKVMNGTQEQSSICHIPTLVLDDFVDFGPLADLAIK